MTFIVKGDGKFVTSCVVDSLSRYQVQFTDSYQDRFDFFITDAFDTLLLRSGRFSEEDNVFDFSLPITYEMENGKAICPVCKRADEVWEIQYGDGAEPGKIAGGCVTSMISPHWYCSRDNVKF